jgi:hypothetical protein
MNELIEKLAREAADAEGWGPEVWQTTFAENFAELIVREVTNIVLHFTDVDEGVAVAKKHFGVSE